MFIFPFIPLYLVTQLLLPLSIERWSAMYSNEIIITNNSSFSDCHVNPLSLPRFTHSLTVFFSSTTSTTMTSAYNNLINDQHKNCSFVCLIAWHSLSRNWIWWFDTVNTILRLRSLTFYIINWLMASHQCSSWQKMPQPFLDKLPRLVHFRLCPCSESGYKLKNLERRLWWCNSCNNFRYFFSPFIKTDFVITTNPNNILLKWFNAHKV